MRRLVPRLIPQLQLRTVMLIFIKTRPNLVLSVVLQLECVGGRAVLQYPLAGVEAELSTQQERAGP